MQTLVDTLVLINAMLVALCIVRKWGSERCVQNLLGTALGALVLAMLFTLVGHDDWADYAATVGYYLICAVVIAFAIQRLDSRKRPRT